MSKNPRLYPHWTSPRYYGLNKLREAIITITGMFLKQTAADKVLLDYGCGSMPYRELYEPHLKKYIGADISINPQAEILINQDSGKIEMPDKSVDYVLSTQVLEHVESPNDYLREAYRVAKDDSYLIISTHGFWLYHPDPTDYWRWTYSGLQKTLLNNGWEPVHHIGIIGLAGAGLSLFQDAVSPRLPFFFRKSFCVVMQRLIKFSDRFYSEDSRKENSTLYLVVAKKC